jgi:hypothetical protein
MGFRPLLVRSQSICPCIVYLPSPAIMSAVRYLHLIQISELASFPTEQCLRGIALHDTACTEDGDAVEIDNGVEAVCNGDDGAVFEFFADDGLHQGIGVYVDTVVESRLAW